MSRVIHVDVLDALHQLCAELEVVWCALTNPNHTSDVSVAISEHVNGIRRRLEETVVAMEGGAK